MQSLTTGTYACFLLEVKYFLLHRKVRQTFLTNLCWGKTHDNNLEAPSQVCRGQRLHPNLDQLQH